MIFDREGRNEIDSLSKDVEVACAERPSAKVETWAARRVKMTLNQFSFFATVAKHLSLTKASAALRVSQPSITQQLKQLENYYRAKLYRRTSKGIEITEGRAPAGPKDYADPRASCRAGGKISAGAGKSYVRIPGGWRYVQRAGHVVAQASGTLAGAASERRTRVSN